MTLLTASACTAGHPRGSRASPFTFEQRRQRPPLTPQLIDQPLRGHHLVECNNKIASSERRLPPPTSSDRSRLTTSSGPSKRNSICERSPANAYGPEDQLGRSGRFRGSHRSGGWIGEAGAAEVDEGDEWLGPWKPKEQYDSSRTLEFRCWATRRFGTTVTWWVGIGVADVRTSKGSGGGGGECLIALVRAWVSRGPEVGGGGRR